MTLFISSLYADAKIYVGAGTGLFNEKFSSIEATNDSNLASIKIGYGRRDSYAVEFSVDYIGKDSNIYSSNDGDKIGYNIDLIKAFDLGIYINPYLKAGFGAGYFNVTSDRIDDINYGSFNLGFGTYIPINESFDFEVGYSYRNTSYERSDTRSSSDSKSYLSHVNIIYTGVNFRF